MTNTVLIPDENRWDVTKALPELRWVSRLAQVGANPMDLAYMKFLQQRWIRQSIVNDIVIEAKYEWRDVPTALEETDD